MNHAIRAHPNISDSLKSVCVNVRGTKHASHLWEQAVSFAQAINRGLEKHLDLALFLQAVEPTGLISGQENAPAM
jgi:hypothetical protein